jgi:uncharacterized protein involved in tolerance to divalent cations
MKPEDKDKLNECIDILGTTDLGLSMVWLWTWSTIKGFIESDSEDWIMVATEDEMWDHLCKAVESGHGFSLEYGAEQHYEEVQDWMLENGYMKDPFYEEEEEEDEDE